MPRPPLPRTLQTAGWLLTRPAFLRGCWERYGDVFQVDVWARAVWGPGAGTDRLSWVFLADPADVETVFRAQPKRVLTGETNRWLEGLVGSRSILVLDEPEHMAERRLLLPPFHGERVRRYAERIAEIAHAQIAGWPRGRPFSLWPHMQALTLEVIVQAVFGLTRDPQHERVREALAGMLNRMTSPRWLATQGVRATLRRSSSRDLPDTAEALRLVGPVEEIVRREIRQRRAAPDIEERDDILSMLVRARYEDGSAMSDETLRDELMTLLIAGHESTATALAWAFELLVRHPGAYEQLRAEAATDDDRYAEAVVRETLRLRPVVPFVLRELAEPMELGGHWMPTGTWVAPCAFLVHQRPEIYPEPHEFRPERFLAEGPGTYTWLPFGGSVRRCVGASFAQLEMKEVLRAVARAVELRPAGSRPERVATRFITLAPGKGARVVASDAVRPPTAAPREPAVAEHVSA